MPPGGHGQQHALELRLAALPVHDGEAERGQRC